MFIVMRGGGMVLFGFLSENKSGSSVKAEIDSS